MRVLFNWLKDYVDIRASAEETAEQLTMAGFEVTSATRLDGDVIFEIEVTPNRADCLSIIGIARELAAITGKKLILPGIPAVSVSAGLIAAVQIQEKQLCRRYLGRVIDNIEVDASPAWLIQRLEAMGIHPVNNVVDITNFCLLEFGQPLHAFDLDKLEGRRIIVRRARDAERIVTIDGVQRSLDTDTLVIADKLRPQAVAGIMGGKESEVGSDTRRILLESAYFDPLHVHHTSRRLGLATQSSYRFERGVDIAGVQTASVRAAALIKQLSGVKKGGTGKKSRRRTAVKTGALIDKGVKTQPRVKVRLRYAQVSRLLGAEIIPVQIKKILRDLQFTLLKQSKDSVLVSIPNFRADICREADLVEEVARLYGYGHIPLRLCRLAPEPDSCTGLTLREEIFYGHVRSILAALGLNEIMTYSLISRQALRKLDGLYQNPQDIIAVKNPLSYEQELLRPTLLAGMLGTLANNINRKNLDLKLFELSRIYLRKDRAHTQELTNLCIGLAGKKAAHWQARSSVYNFYNLKGILESTFSSLKISDFRFQEAEYPLFTPGRCAAVMIGENRAGFLGQVNKKVSAKFDLPHPVFAAEIQLHQLPDCVPAQAMFQPLPRFPAVERDISLIVCRDITSEQIVSLIKDTAGALVADVMLFDQYDGEPIPTGSRGLAYSITYRSKERTLTAEEVDTLHTKIRQALCDTLQAQIR